MKYISVGSTCGVAYQFQQLGIKQESLPFDWVKSISLNNVLTILKYGFGSFGAYNDLILTRESKKHPVLRTDQWDDYVISPISYVYQNSLGITFYHDFEKPFTNEVDDVYVKFKNKYSRRFKRLYELFASGDELVFVRDEHKPHHLKLEIIIEFVDWLRSQLTNGTTMKFILIINNPKNKVFDWTSKLDSFNIRFYNDNKHITDWQRSGLDWKTILEI
ncbi:putative papain-like cysteine peptidase [Tupanvirus deep ocean]|uniref:Papain-like cysteine peptidase n=2 Tax=Tupanvirus TaxID=2094720 RepID=A0AC62A8S2_9VIRU|nr:putative papain-like cysteine peptidase [Tupanvirus deep ocean]QKU34013.1 putative papain-like cysteine peptidase [Tupanvirus deep ocean]